MKTTLFFLILIFFCFYTSVSADVGSSISVTVHATLDGDATYIPTATPSLSPTTTTYHSPGGGGGGGSSTFTPKPQPTTITTTPPHVSQQVVSTTPAPTTVIPTITATSTPPPVVIVGEGSGMVWGIVIIVVIGVTIVAYLW